MWLIVILGLARISAELQSANNIPVQCENSSCTNLEECAPVNAMLHNSHLSLHPLLLKFLKTQICGFHDDKPKICCPNPVPDPKKNLLNLTKITDDVIQESFPCKESFDCVHILDCSPLLYLMKLGKPLEGVVMKLMKRQQCGVHEDGYAKVCCKLSTAEDFTNVTTTEEPTTTPSMDLKTKSRILNYYYQEYFDFTMFDLFRRKRDSLHRVEIEIR